MSKRKKYVAIYERDREDDAWLVHIEGIDGCHTYGRTLRQTADHIEEALAVWLDSEPEQLEIDHRWPDELLELSDEVATARQKAAQAATTASEATIAAAQELERMGLSRRDTAEILGISHQRVQQLLAS